MQKAEDREEQITAAAAAEAVATRQEVEAMRAKQHADLEAERDKLEARWDCM